MRRRSAGSISISTRMRKSRSLIHFTRKNRRSGLLGYSRCNLPLHTSLDCKRDLQNTLGRQWMQMHPDSSLITSLDYLVPLKEENLLPSLSNPSGRLRSLIPHVERCISGLSHSISILKCTRRNCKKQGNLDGRSLHLSQTLMISPRQFLRITFMASISIPARCEPLGTLALYLKAKAYRKETKITQSNLTCADILPLDGEHLSAFLVGNTTYRSAL